MSKRRVALAAILLSLTLTFRLISEAFVSYASTVTARDLQAILQTKILYLGSLIGFLQVAAGLAIMTGPEPSKMHNSSQ